jgi:Protein of unknown function (DUF3000)
MTGCDRDVRSRTVTPHAPAEAADAFARAVADLQTADLRPEVTIEEAPAPGRLAPKAMTLVAEVTSHDVELATGRFIVLYDPAEPEEWGGSLRLVTYVRAELEPEMVVDPLLAAVGWTWLTEALTTHGATYVAASGTVSKVSSEGFGGLADRPPVAEVEIRASWTPADERLGAHLSAWGDLLCTAAGLPPAHATDVPSLIDRSSARRKKG